MSRKHKFERKRRQCSELTVSIGIDIWKNARRAHLQQQLSEVTVLQTLLPPGNELYASCSEYNVIISIGWFRVGDGAFGKVDKDPDGILRLSRCVVFSENMEWHVQVRVQLYTISGCIQMSIICYRLMASN